MRKTVFCLLICVLFLSCVLPAATAETAASERISGDFAYILQKIPGCMVNVGMARDGQYSVGHNGRYLVDEAVLDIGTAFLVYYCLDYFGVE